VSERPKSVRFGCLLRSERYASSGDWRGSIRTREKDEGDAKIDCAAVSHKDTSSRTGPDVTMCVLRETRPGVMDIPSTTIERRSSVFSALKATATLVDVTWIRLPQPRVHSPGRGH
jgi:hypothetical protein